MINDQKNLAPDDIKIFLICSAFLFLIVFLPRIDFTNFYIQISNLISFQSDSYDPQNSPIFFSIGEAISALAILFAVYQFKREKWSLALKIRGYIGKVVITGISLGIIFSIIASLVSFIDPKNIFQLSIFWQVISSLLIAFSVIFLLTKATNTKLFNRRSSRKFYEVLAWEISRPDEERLNLALNVLLDNFDNICKAVSKEPHTSEINQSARNILDVILSDSSIVRLLTTKRFDGLMYIISVIKKYNINRSHSPKGIPMIFQGLFLYPDSFLYKQLDRNGLALSANLYSNIFESSRMLNNFDLFGYPTLGFSSPQDITESTVSVFLEAISKSIKTYLKTGEVPARHVNNGIEYISNLFREICSNIREEQVTGTDKRYGKNSNWWLLHRISHFWGHDYLFIGYRERFNEQDMVFNEDILASEKESKEANFNSGLSINEAISAALYRAFEDLSRIEKENDTYHVVLNLLHGMTSEPNLQEGYILPFTQRMWIQIGKNVFGKHYPMVLKSYLQFVGFCLAGDEGQRAGWAGEQAERMRRLLYIDLKPKLDAGEIMVDDTPMKEALLPDCMDYKDGKFTYTMGFGRGPTKVIAPPVEGSESALKDINWEDSRSLV